MRSEKRGLGFALLNFFLAITGGLILRLAFVREISWLDFRSFLQGHSNLAMLGWMFLALILLLGDSFLPKFWQKRKYRILFYLIGFFAVATSLAHVFIPKSVWPILSTLTFILLAYIYIWIFCKDIFREKYKSIFSKRFIYTAFLLFIISTFGLISTSFIQLLHLKHGMWYYMSVQFYLHFQFNGYFIFAVLALLFRFFENNDIRLVKRKINLFFWILLLSCFLTFALALTWGSPHWALFLTNSLGVVAQLISLWMFYKIMRYKLSFFYIKVNSGIRWLLGIAFFSFCLKILVQSAVVVPYIAQVAYTIRNYVIGFIHLIMLGVISAVILAFSGNKSWIDLNDLWVRLGLVCLFSGFVLSELLLILQGTMFWGAFGLLPYYYESLFLVSFLMPLGVLIILIGLIMNRSNNIFQLH